MENILRFSEKKWQEIWKNKKVFEANADESKKKFFLTAPYPYMNGLLHLGHAFTWGRVEIYARYMRLHGYNVLFPAAWHITGSPIVSKSKRLAEGDKKIYKDLLEDGIPEKDIEKLKTPEGWAKYFIEKGKPAFESLGFSIDWRREFYTSYLHPWYNKFIEWQYRKLKEKGLIYKGDHPVVWDPKENLVIGDHDRPDIYVGIGPIEGYIIKFKLKDKIDKYEVILPCFTLRPETVLGVTNIWINPNAKYSLYRVDNEYWILPDSIVIEEIKNQKHNVEKIKDIKVEEILGKYAINLTNFISEKINKEVPILPAEFVDPEIGTGIVMSVPAHAPYDYIALLDLTKDERYRKIAENCLKSMISLFKVEGFSDFPAKDIVEKMKITSQKDKELLEDATKEIYSKEYYNGVLKEIYGKYSGKKIYEIKEEFANELVSKNIAIKHYTLPIRFESRYGNKCIVKIVENQWFLKYSDPEWKKLAHECVDNMIFYPEELRNEFHQKIDWLKDWACTHQRELGTPLPWDKEWILESLSDSTIYMAFYTIAHLIKEIPPEKIEDDLFDYIFLNKGDENKLIQKYGEIIKRMKKEFEYWYPLDLRSSGKDLIPNHLTFFIFHHVAIFDKKYWPKGIAVNGYVLLNGMKMSKSLGNYISVIKAINMYPADVVRFLIAYAGNSGYDDANIELNNAEKIEKYLIDWYNFSINNYNKGREDKKIIDRWFESILNKYIKEIDEEYKKLNYKNVINLIYMLDNEFDWYMKRTLNNPNKEVLNKYIEYKTIVLYPIVPHITSEILEKIGKDPLNIKWPEIGEIDKNIIKMEEYVKEIRKDIINISNILKKKKINKITIILASKEKFDIFKNIKENKEVLDKYLKDKKYNKIALFIKNNMNILNNYLEYEDELRVLIEAKEFLEKEFDCIVNIEKEEESSNNKKERAIPTKPAIIIE